MGASEFTCSSFGSKQRCCSPSKVMGGEQTRTILSVLCMQSSTVKQMHSTLRGRRFTISQPQHQALEQIHKPVLGVSCSPTTTSPGDSWVGPCFPLLFHWSNRGMTKPRHCRCVWGPAKATHMKKSWMAKPHSAATSTIACPSQGF